MKTLLSKVAITICAATSIYSCSLDEYNPSGTGEIILQTFDGWKGMATSCYSPLYDQLFSASDYLFVAETGTDIWLTSNNTTNTQQLFYYEGLTTNTNATDKLFTQAYAKINTCNAVIDRANNLADGDAVDIATIVGEAKCLRAFYYLVLTTQYGEIPLSTEEATTADFNPKRASSQDIYNQITTDLKDAAKKLGVTPYEGNYARCSKKTALGLLARAYAQGAGEGLTENNISYWQRAKEVAEDLIANKDTYGAYLYDNIDDVWAQKNNRNNKEALFVAAGPQAGSSDAFSYGSYGSNKLFTYTFCDPNKLNDIYKIANKQNYFYGRVNNCLMAPSKYLINCFDAKYDKRWENSFTTAFAQFSMVQPSWVKYNDKIVTITNAIAEKYGNKPGKIYPYVDLAAINQTYGGNQYVASVWPKGEYSGDITKLTTVKNVYANPYPLDKDEDRFLIYLSKDDMSAQEKAERLYVTININDLFNQTGKYVESSIDGKTNTYTLFPSLNKFNWSYDGSFYGSNLQCKTGDMFIMRMAEIYLIAAEAEQKLGNGEKAAEYLNVLRKRACRNAGDFDAHMKLTTATEDDIFDEYARELCGEFNRWALLKRHKAFETRLAKYNSRAAESFTSKNYLRPISYTFLNQIENAEEFGTNGY